MDQFILWPTQITNTSVTNNKFGAFGCPRFWPKKILQKKWLCSLDASIDTVTLSFQVGQVPENNQNIHVAQKIWHLWMP